VVIFMLYAPKKEKAKILGILTIVFTMLSAMDLV